LFELVRPSRFVSVQPSVAFDKAAALPSPQTAIALAAGVQPAGTQPAGGTEHLQDC